MMPFIKAHKKKLKLTVYLLAVVLFAVYLLNANTLAASLLRESGDIVRYEGSLDDFENTAPTHAFVNEIHYMGDFRQTVRIFATAFAESEEAIPLWVDKKGYIILTSLDSPSTIYIGEGEPQRGEMWFDRLQGKYKLPSRQLVLMSTFSIIGVPQGTYQIHYYIEEREDLCGLAYSGTNLRITGTEAYNALEDPADVPNANVGKSTDYLSHIAAEEIPSTGKIKKYQLNGWAINKVNPGSVDAVYTRLTSASGETRFYEMNLNLYNEELAEAYDQPLDEPVAFYQIARWPAALGEPEVSVIFEKDGRFFEEEKDITKPVPVDTSDLETSERFVGFCELVSTGTEDEVQVTGWATPTSTGDYLNNCYIEMTAENGQILYFPVNFTENNSEVALVNGQPADSKNGFFQTLSWPGEYGEPIQT